MTALNHIVQLDDLLNELRLITVVVLDDDPLKLFSQSLIAFTGLLNPWEKVTDNALEQSDVVSQEFRQVHITDGSKDQHLFSLL